MSFADQLPNRHFTDMRLNEKILMSGPPTIDSDSEFNRHSTIMSHIHGGQHSIRSNKRQNKDVGKNAEVFDMMGK